MNRRHFLMGTAIIAGNAVVRGVQSPNDTVRVGIAGLGGRGSAHVSAWAAMKNVQIAGLCDVDEAHVGEKMNALDAKGVKPTDGVHGLPPDARDKDIDAVSIATPNHWHALQTIWACQAGKDVYVEKPCSHNIFESQQMVAAARKYDRIVQQGSQSRSAPGAAARRSSGMRSGEIGKVYMARGLCYKWRDTIGKTPGRAGAARRRLRPLARPGTEAPVHEEPLPLQLALVLGYRQRRHRQPGHPRDGHRPLGPRRHAPDEGHRDGRQVHVRRRSGDAEHDQRGLRVRRRRQEEDDDVRSAPLDLTARSGHRRRQTGQHHRQPVLRLQGLSGHGNTTSTTRSWERTSSRGRRARGARSTSRTSSTPCAAASGRT